MGQHNTTINTNTITSDNTNTAAAGASALGTFKPQVQVDERDDSTTPSCAT